MTSMISLIVVLLAAYAYAAPIVPDFQNATVVMEVENATSYTEGENVTISFQSENVLILARRDASVVTDDKNGKVKVSLSSSESDSNETTDHPSQREFEETYTTEDTKRSIDTEDNKQAASSEEERSYTEDSFTTENTKRGIDVEYFESSTAEDSFTTENTKRGIDVDFFESSTAEDSSVPPSGHIENAKRSMDNGQWLASGSDDTRPSKRSFNNEQWLADSSDKVNKRSIEIIESSTDVDETSTGEYYSVPSTSEVNNMKRESEDFSSWTTEASEAFNRRAIGSVESVQAGEASTVIVIKVQPESTTEEQPSSSSTVEYVDTTEFSSTSDYETTVVPVEEWSSASPIPSGSTSKILAIIPGTISRTQYVVPPVQQVQLSQVQNQTVVETEKPHY